MSVSEVIFIALVVLAMISILGFLAAFIFFQAQRKNILSLPVKRLRNQKKNKQVFRKRQKFLKKKKYYGALMIAMASISLVFVGGAAYTSYYQTMNLTSRDSVTVVKGYYLIRDFEEQLKLIEVESEEKLQQNIRYLSTAMASYGIQKASDLNSKEGQLALNRYYTAIKQLGMNASTQANNFHGNPATVKEFIQDVEKVKVYENVVFDYFKVNESALSEEKQKLAEK